MSYGDFVNEKSLNLVRRFILNNFGTKAAALAETDSFRESVLMLLSARANIFLTLAIFSRFCFHAIALMIWKFSNADTSLLLVFGISGIVAAIFVSKAMDRQLVASVRLWRYVCRVPGNSILVRAADRAKGRAFEVLALVNPFTVVFSVCVTIWLLVDAVSIARLALVVTLLALEMLFSFLRGARYFHRWRARVADSEAQTVLEDTTPKVLSMLTKRDASIIGKTTSGRCIVSPNTNRVHEVQFLKLLAIPISLVIFAAVIGTQLNIFGAIFSALLLLFLATLATAGFAWVVSAIISALRYMRDNSCNLGVFWRFDKAEGKLARTTIVPLLSLLGTVWIVKFRDYEEQSNLEGLAELSWIQPIALPWLNPRANVVAEELNLMNRKWRDDVKALIRSIDVAVFVFTRPSESLAWEFQQAIHELPLGCIYVVYPKQCHDDVEQFLISNIGSSSDLESWKQRQLVPYSASFFGKQLLKFELVNRLRNNSRQMGSNTISDETLHN